jgi:hypothetical protein
VGTIKKLRSPRSLHSRDKFILDEAPKINLGLLKKLMYNDERGAKEKLAASLLF